MQTLYSVIYCYTVIYCLCTKSVLTCPWKQVVIELKRAQCTECSQFVVDYFLIIWLTLLEFLSHQSFICSHAQIHTCIKDHLQWPIYTSSNTLLVARRLPIYCSMAARWCHDGTANCLLPQWVVLGSGNPRGLTHVSKADTENYRKPSLQLDVMRLHNKDNSQV